VLLGPAMTLTLPASAGPQSTWCAAPGPAPAVPVSVRRLNTGSIWRTGKGCQEERHPRHQASFRVFTPWTSLRRSARTSWMSTR
jgi:hypothetical protein